MRKLLLILLLLPQVCLAVDYEADVKALSPTSWFKSYYGNTIVSGWEPSATKDFSGNSKSFAQGTSGLRPYLTFADDAENLVAYSNSLDLWSNNNITVTANAVANPLSGHTTADLLTATANGAYRWYDLLANQVIAGATYISSIYVKAGTATYAQIRIGDGAASKYSHLKFSDGTCTTTAGTTCAVETLSGGWYRLVQTWPSVAASGTGQFLICPNNGVGELCTTSNTMTMYAWGAQMRRSTSGSRYADNDLAVARFPGVNGLTSFYFDKGNDTLEQADFIGTGAFTIFATLRPYSMGEGDLGRVIDNGSRLISLHTTNNGFAYLCGGVIAYTANNTYVPHVPVIYAATMTAGGVTNQYLNNILSGAANQSCGVPAAATTNLFLGNNSTGARTWHGDIVELITFGSVLSTANRTKVYDYLSWTLNNPWKRVEVTP